MNLVKNLQFEPMHSVCVHWTFSHYGLRRGMGRQLDVPIIHFTTGSSLWKQIGIETSYQRWIRKISFCFNRNFISINFRFRRHFDVFNVITRTQINFD